MKPNKVIAEFMEVKFDKGNFYNMGYDIFSNGNLYRSHELKYHTSWDWLMPVVEKINLLDNYRYTVYIASMDTKIVDNISGNVIVEIDCKHSIDELRQSVYEAVVKFIKNQTK